MSNLYSYFQNFLKNNQKKILLTKFADYSFKDIDEFSGKLANSLSNLDMLPGDRLASQVEKSEYSLFLYLACLRSGFIYLPLNNAYTEEELSYFFSDAKPKIIICDPKNEPIINKIKGVSIIKTLDEKGRGSLSDEMRKIKKINHIVYHINPDQVAVIIYTSGTTGKPKGAMITHQGLLCNAQDINKTWCITERDTILHMLPLFHVHGLFFALHTALLSGARIILLPKFDVEHFFEYLPKSTIFMGVPTYFTRLLNDNRLNSSSCQNMRLFISGSAPLLKSTFECFKSRTNHTLIERYGMTETGINTSNPLKGHRKAGSVGLSLPSISIRVVNDNNKQVPLFETGHIQIKGNNLFKGYWMNSDKTKDSFTDDGYFKTGDLGIIDEDGYLSIVARCKDLIISGGLNIYPKEIELTINCINGVLESVVIGVPHPDLGEAVVAIVEGDGCLLNELLIIQYVKKHKAAYKIPKKVFIVDAIPKNTMGKVQKNILREQFLKIFQI